LQKIGMRTGRENGYVIHSLRHSFETICVNAGIPQRVVDAWLGHSSDRSMATVYYRLSEEESQKFMQQVPFGTGVPAANAGEEQAC
jgi:integrase